ncbi:MAG: DUF2807 domain-containing protein [Flammeovirgaceae bacterium]|nr:DUF2807 domain-containing protein [Flammeovirgaceae bacterium]
MKITNKIIISLASLLAICVFSFLISFRMNMQSANAAEPEKYKLISVPEFESLKIEKNWHVEIVNGEQTEIKINSSLEKNIPVVENGVLNFKATDDSGSHLWVKIAMPHLKRTIVEGGELRVRGIIQDSMKLQINTGEVYLHHCNFEKVNLHNVNGHFSAMNSEINFMDTYTSENAESSFSAKKVFGEVLQNSNLNLRGHVDSLNVKFSPDSNFQKF